MKRRKRKKEFEYKKGTVLKTKLGKRIEILRFLLCQFLNRYVNTLSLLIH